MNLRLIRSAFLLILLSLFGGFAIPLLAVPRLGLSAHTIGLLSAAILIGVGIVWPRFDLSARQRLCLEWSWIGSSYLNWGGCLAGAIFGTGRNTPVASAGLEGSDFAELLVNSMLVATAALSLIATALSLWGLRSRSSPDDLPPPSK